MDNLKKHLTGKKKEGEALRTALDSVYRECGEVQFEYALQHSKDIRYVNEQEFTAWKTLRETRRQTADSILTIKTAQSRQNELKVFYGEIDKLLHKQQGDYEKTRNKFILLFFQTYQSDSLPCITQIKQTIAPLKENIEKTETDKQALEREKNDAHLFKKLAINPQLIALKRKLSGLKKKMEEHIIASGDSLLTESVIREVRGTAFPEDLEALYSEFLSLTAKRDEMGNRREALQAEQEKLKETLTECGVNDSPQKRIGMLTAQIKKIDKEITDAERRQGILYADTFYADDGTSKEAAFTEEPESFKAYLASIAEYRIKLEKNRLSIEYIENELALAGEVRRIETLHEAIARYRDGIAQYEQLIESAEQAISQSEALKAELKEKNAALSAQIPLD